MNIDFILGFDTPQLAAKVQPWMKDRNCLKTRYPTQQAAGYYASFQAISLFFNQHLNNIFTILLFVDKKQENKAWFDRWAQTYDRFIFRRFMWYWQDRTLAELTAKSKTILEIACGTGVGTEKAARLFPRAKIIATDLSPVMLTKARERLRNKANVTLKLADVERLSLKQKFDSVFCTEAFHHFPNPAKAMSEISKATKKNGLVAITDIHIPPLMITNILFKLEPGFVHMYTRKKWRALFEDAGFEVIKQKRTGLFALMTIGKKR